MSLNESYQEEVVDEIAITGHDDLEEETTTEAVSRLELETKAERRFASHSPTLVSGFPCSHRWPGKIMSVRGLLRPITAPPTLAAKILQPSHGRSLSHF